MFAKYYAKGCGLFKEEKMLFRMDFIPKDEIGPEDAEARIQYFLLALRENGQILEDFELIQNRRYAAVFASYSRKHLDPVWDSEDAVRHRAELLRDFDLKLTALGKSPLRAKACTCKRRWLVMSTYCDDRDSPLICGDCGRAVPLCELALSEDDLGEVRAWQQNFRAVHRLWINGLSERWAEKQLTDVNSALNRQGLQIAKALKQKLGMLVCCEIFSPDENQTHFACPVCGKPLIWKCGEPSEMVCEFCALCYEN